MVTQNSKNSFRIGFTLIELLVILAIIAIIVALAIPAVQSTRELARKQVCANRIRNISVAIHSHSSSHEHLPPIGVKLASIPEGQFTIAFSWQVAILPYLEQSNLYEAFNGNEDSTSQHNKQLASSFRPNVFVCPSDPNATEFLSATNYLCNAGPHPSLGDLTGPIDDNGILISQAMIRRGLSNVVCVGEIGIHGKKKGTVFDAGRLRFTQENVGPGDSYEKYRQASLNAVATVFDDTLGSSWYIAGIPNNGYNHALRPNTKSCKFKGEDVQTLSSYHPSGVHSVRCDGSVHFVNNSIDLKIWLEMGAIEVGSFYD